MVSRSPRGCGMQRPHTRVVLISGFARPEDESEIAGLGAKLLRKPFDASALRAAIGDALLATPSDET